METRKYLSINLNINGLTTEQEALYKARARELAIDASKETKDVFFRIETNESFEPPMPAFPGIGLGPGFGGLLATQGGLAATLTPPIGIAEDGEAALDKS